MNIHCMIAWLTAGLLTVSIHAEDPIIPPDAVVETVSTGDFRFTEGPALAPDGSIYFTDIPNNAIHRYDPETGKKTLFTDDSGGANGLMFVNGFLYACAGKARELRIYPGKIENATEPDPQNPGGWIATPRWSGPHLRHVEEHALGEYGGRRLNSPNDFVASNDVGYFTDPRYGNRDDMEQEVEAVYAIVPNEEQTNFVIHRIIDNLVRPNGIGLSPDEQTLYVNDNGDKKIWAYPILEPSKLGEARLLNDLADLGGPDGMTVDHAGRIYTTIYGKGVLILSPEGDRLGFLETGPQTTNCTFGADGKTLYITAERGLKRVVLNTGAE